MDQASNYFTPVTNQPVGINTTPGKIGVNNNQIVPPVLPVPPITQGQSTPSPQTPIPVSPPVNNIPPKGSKKIFTVILIVILVLAILGAVYFFFGKDLLKTKRTGGKKTTLVYWGLFEDPVVFQQVIADYEKLNPKVEIKYTQENLFEYDEKLKYRLPQGTGPDIFRIHQSWVPSFGNLLSPLPSSVMSSSEYEKIFYPSTKNSLKYNGSYVAIPLMQDGLSLYYNEDIFKAAGKTPPTTWDELRRTAIDLTVRDSQGRIKTAGVAMGITGNVDHWSDILGLLMLQNGADLSNPVLCTQDINDPCRGVSAFDFYTVFFKTDRVWDNSLPSSTFAFSTGILAMYFGPSWRVFEIKQKNPSLNFGVIPVPQLPGRNINWASYWVEAVSKSSKYQAEAWNFLKYLSSVEGMQQLYQNESQLRLFGEPYSRKDMADLTINSPYVGAYIKQAPEAVNWYLSSFTGETNGINGSIIKYYEDGVNQINQGQDPNNVLSTVSQGVTQVLSRYGVISVNP